MISELTRQRWRAFRSRRLSYLSLLVLGGLFLLSLFSEFLANNVPIALRHQGAWYFPVFRDYAPQVFGQQDTFVVDYRAVRAALEQGQGAEGWALWPPVFWGPYETDLTVESFPSPPDARHWLGTDNKGRDLLVRLIYGFRVSLAFALAVWALSFLIGVAFGAAQGYLGGRVDFYGQRFSEIWSAVPVFFLILTLIVILAPSLLLLILLYALFGWPHIAQYERAEFLRLRRLEYVDAARALGASPLRIMARHLLPNALVPVVTFTPFAIAGAITSIAALDYLGFGVPPPTPSWGELLRQALSHFTTAWWIAAYTVGAMFFTLLLLVFINEGVREAFDPHRRRG